MQREPVKSLLCGFFPYKGGEVTPKICNLIFAKNKFPQWGGGGYQPILQFFLTPEGYFLGKKRVVQVVNASLDQGQKKIYDKPINWKIF